MIDLSAAITELLLSHSQITDLAGQRVYTDHLPQNAQLPAIVHWVSDERAHEALDGPIGLDQAAVMMVAYGSSRPKATELAREIWQQLCPGEGVVSAGVWFHGITRQAGISHLTDRPTGGAAAYRYAALQRLLFTYNSLAEVV